MALPTVSEVINTYLYGVATPPVMPLGVSIGGGTIEIDVNEFMAGPGRFATPAQFDIVQGFFNSPPGTFTAGRTYTKAEVMSELGLGDTWNMQQYNWEDGTLDIAQRTFLYNSQMYTMGDATQFVVALNGDKSLNNFTAVPPTNENFDFDSNDGFAKFANPILNKLIDPTGIGDTVYIEFVGTQTPTWSTPILESSI